MKLEGEVHEEQKINPARCLISGCHAETKQVPGKPLFDKKAAADYDAKCEFIVNKAVRPVEVVTVLYDYKFVLEDGSKGVHNTRYAVQLLMDAIKAMDKNFDDSKRPE